MTSWPWVPSRAKISLVLLLAAAGAAIFLYSQDQPPPQIDSPAGVSFLVVLGVQDTNPTVWDGCLTVTGSDVIGTSVWRQGAGDAISTGPCGTDPTAGTTWKLRTRRVSIGPSGKPSLPENGLIVTVAARDTDIAFDVTIAHQAGATPEKFTFHSDQLPFGTAQRFLNGRAYVTRTASPLQLTSSIEEEDFP